MSGAAKISKIINDKKLNALTDYMLGRSVKQAK